MNEFDRDDPFDHLEAELVLAAQPQRRAMQDADRLAVHLVGEDRQFVAHVLDLVNVIIAPAIGAVGQEVKYGVPRLRRRLHRIEDVPHCGTPPHSATPDQP